MTRDEEVAASVAALAETVAEQEQTLDDWTHLVHARLETHSQRMSQSNAMLVKAVTELCDLVDWLAVGTVHMIGVDACSQINERTAALRALESPAAAPEPVCQCGHTKRSHIRGQFGPWKCEAITRTRSGYESDDLCDCTEFVPAEPPAAVPDAGGTDSVLLAIRDLYELIVTGNDYDQMTCRLGRELRYEWERITKPDQEWHSADVVDTAIRAYGRDGAS